MEKGILQSKKIQQISPLLHQISQATYQYKKSFARINRRSNRKLHLNNNDEAFFYFYTLIMRALRINLQNTSKLRPLIKLNKWNTLQRKNEKRLNLNITILLVQTKLEMELWTIINNLFNVPLGRASPGRIRRHTPLIQPQEPKPPLQSRPPSASPILKVEPQLSHSSAQTQQTQLTTGNANSPQPRAYRRDPHKDPTPLAIAVVRSRSINQKNKKRDGGNSTHPPKKMWGRKDKDGSLAVAVAVAAAEWKVESAEL